MATATSSAAAATSALSASSATKTQTTKEMSDQFLKLLITQMQNQDPLNPMDNAQVTSQMAQINTVSGLEKVNDSLQSMSTQLVQLQAMQGASLVGRSVVVPGNRLDVSSGSATGLFELAGAADADRKSVV